MRCGRKTKEIMMMICGNAMWKKDKDDDAAAAAAADMIIRMTTIT